MHRIRVYADTSVFGGVEDPEFAEPSRRFFERVRDGTFILVLSPFTVRELDAAPAPVKQLLEDLPPENVEHVEDDADVAALADSYIAAGVLSEACRMDALHVAAGTVGRADLILSWNFKHIVNYQRIRRFNGVNALKGYASIEIRSPLEVDYEDQDEDEVV